MMRKETDCFKNIVYKIRILIYVRIQYGPIEKYKIFNQNFVEI